MFWGNELVGDRDDLLQNVLNFTSESLHIVEKLAHCMKRPTLTKSTSSSTSDNSSDQIAPRDDGKSPR